MKPVMAKMLMALVIFSSLFFGMMIFKELFP